MDGHNSSSYFLGKLHEAVHILTVDPGDARARLRACWNLFAVAGGGVPEHLQTEYREIYDELTKRQYQSAKWEDEWEHKRDIYLNDVGWVAADSPYGRMAHTTQTMKNKTASRLAERILTLSLQWRDCLESDRRSNLNANRP